MENCHDIKEIIKNLINSSPYDFLRNDTNLSHISLLTLGGSYAYGMNKEGSDIDIRGFALNSKEEILLRKDFEQVVDVTTDTTVYSFNKLITLLSSCNPNTIEILGCLPEHYIILDDVGRGLISNRDMFLSKICIHTFGGYASSQLRRLENKAARLVDQSKNEEYIYKSVLRSLYEIRTKYKEFKDEDNLELYVSDSDQEGYDSEIFMDVILKHYPLRDWVGLWNEMKSIVRSYSKIGKRNEKAIEHNKLGKHMAHLLRLYMMVIDILNKKEIITYREDEHDLLMSIRNGEFLDENRQPLNSFYSILEEYEAKFEEAQKNTSLPDKPDYSRIDRFKMSVNEKVVKGELFGCN